VSDWSDTIEYINSFPNENWVITPKKVKDKVGGNNDTIALYVNYLHKAMYLKRTGRGVYRKVRDIPTDLSLSKIQRFIYPYGLGWEERKKNIQRYWLIHDLKEKINNKNK